MSRAERPPRLRSASTSSDQLSLGRGEALTATRTPTRLHRAYECAPHDVAALEPRAWPRAVAPGPGAAFRHRDRRTTVRCTPRSVRPPRCCADSGISTFETCPEPRRPCPARPVPKDSPCLTLCTASATSPAATRGRSSAPGSSIAVSIFMLNSTSGGSYDETFSLPGSESQAAADAIQDRFPQQTLYSSNVIFHSEDGLTGPDEKAAIEQAVEQLVRRSARDRREQSLRPSWTDPQRRRADRLRHGRLRHREGRHHRVRRGREGRPGRP